MIDARTPVLQARDVSVRFGGVVAVDQVSIHLERGEICGIMGPNGAGKTTLFDVLSGVRRPTSGRVSLDGDDVTSWSPVRRARAGVRRTFQRQQTFGWLSVRENLRVAVEPAGGVAALLADLVRLRSGGRRLATAETARVDAALQLCGLEDVADRSAATLDIGRARMVELARVVVAEPRVLLLDEPTSGLEERETAQLAATVGRLRDTTGCAVALVEHDVAFMFEHCDRIVVLDLGRVLAEGTPDEVRNDPAVATAYLGAKP
jgi:branched-chain amino acid transport system ATP-binding protein